MWGRDIKDAAYPDLIAQLDGEWLDPVVFKRRRALRGEISGAA